MSLQPEPIGPIPELTARVAKASFPKGNVYLRIRDVLGPIYEDVSFALLFAPQGRPAESPWRLALVTVLQFREGLSDRQAADAVRGRIDWKYALGLELTDPGFDFSVLSEFRTRLIEGSAEASLLEALLAGCRAKGYLSMRGRQRTDSTHVLGALRILNRLEHVAETLRAALNALAQAAPDWLRAQASPDWFERYGRRIEDYRLPKGQEARQEFARTVGQDGLTLLEAVYGADAPAGLRELAEVQVLRRVWIQQFAVDGAVEGTLEGGAQDGTGAQVANQADFAKADDDGEEGAVGEGAGEEVSTRQVHLREPKDQPEVGDQICSPYETEARYSQKRGSEWTGYKCHYTESCDEALPRLVIHVDTTIATIPDIVMLGPIQEGLFESGLLPKEQLVDGGYVGASELVESKERYQIDLVGPTLPSHSWQARANEGFSATSFQVDFEAKTASCPMGKQSSQWTPIETSTGVPMIHVGFRKTDCQACPVREKCTNRARNHPRTLTLHPEPEQKALEAARKREKTEPFWRLYGLRSGIEGTFSQGVRALGLREARYRGLAKTHLQDVATACAIDIGRIDDWLNEVPRAKTRTSHFAALRNLN